MAQLSDDCFAFGGPMMSVEQAAALMADRMTPLAVTETVLLGEADGRVLARNVVAKVSLPPFANSAVDGYAVRFDDLLAEGETRLPLRGRVPAGVHPGGLDGVGAAIRIFTGAPMPPGTDTVFMQEDVVLEGGHVRLPGGLKRGANARLPGEDIAAGDLALASGQFLQPQELALAAATGHTHLVVRARPCVAIFSTGNELTEPGAALQPAAIYDANRVALVALVRRAGGVVTDLGILRDDPVALAAALDEAARDHDLILTSGGVSTGEEDHVKAAVEAVGSLVFWRIAIKPGRPVAMGVIRGTAFIGLPGNPVAAFVTFAFVVRPLLRALSGAALERVQRLPVTLGFDYRKKTGRREYVRVSLTGADGQMTATKFPRDGAGVLTSLTRTDGLVELGEDLIDVKAGTQVPFLAYRMLM